MFSTQHKRLYSTCERDIYNCTQVIWRAYSENLTVFTVSVLYTGRFATEFFVCFFLTTPRDHIKWACEFKHQCKEWRFLNRSLNHRMLVRLSLYADSDVIAPKKIIIGLRQIMPNVLWGSGVHCKLQLKYFILSLYFLDFFYYIITRKITQK